MFIFLCSMALTYALLRVISTYSSECACEIIKPLVDLRAKESESVTLNLGLSKSRRVTWLKGESPLSDNDRYHVSVSDDGLDHKLTINDVTMTEHDKFTATVDDNEYGSIASTCSLSVQGMTQFRPS